VNDPIARAKRWQLFYDEEGGLKDILSALEVAYLERMGTVEPWETDKLVKLSVASKVTRAIADEVRSIIAAGQVAESQRAHVKKIESLPGTKRRWI